MYQLSLPAKSAAYLIRSGEYATVPLRTERVLLTKNSASDHSLRRESHPIQSDGFPFIAVISWTAVDTGSMIAALNRFVP